MTDYQDELTASILIEIDLSELLLPFILEDDENELPPLVLEDDEDELSPLISSSESNENEVIILTDQYQINSISGLLHSSWASPDENGSNQHSGQSMLLVEMCGRRQIHNHFGIDLGIVRLLLRLNQVNNDVIPPLISWSELESESESESDADEMTTLNIQRQTTQSNTHISRRHYMRRRG
jgi:hypothetical protein